MRTLQSWGRYPALPQQPYPALAWPDQVPGALQVLQPGGTLPYGNGRSYGDSCLAASNQVLPMRGLDRVLAADWHAGWVRAEAGITLEQILQVSVPRGWFLPVAPGTRFATLGGAIANDVHGKNHHQRGTFGRFVRAFTLVRSDAGAQVCSPQLHPELFAATIGGLGLTGVITSAEIRLVPIGSSRLRTVTQRFDQLADFFALSAELDAQHEFCVSWIDCVAKGSGLGRGIYTAGDFATDGPLTTTGRPRLRMPFTPPVSLVNAASLQVFNQAYWRRAPARRTAGLSDYGRFFFPLDGILHWNRMYGPRGFQQYQCLIPEAAAQPAIQALLEAIADSGQGSFLAVLKRCGNLPSPGLLSFPRPGTSLALDFAQSDRLVQVLFPRLDAIVRAAGGCFYPAKDAHMQAADFRRAYPAWEAVEGLRDPALNSHFWRRVTA